MIFEIKGIGIPNKGAELMLIAIQEKISLSIPNAKFVVEASGEYVSRAMYGLYQKPDFKLFNVPINFLFDLLPKKTRYRLGIILENEIDVIIDASGFAYGDQWGPDKANTRMAKNIKKWKKNGKIIILMPQAFGPFENVLLHQHMIKIAQNADLIYARDDISLSHLLKIKKTIKKYPDFTNLVKGYPSLDFTPTSKDICFIPNAKMITMSSTTIGEIYIDQLKEAIEYCQDLEINPYFLIHEGAKDNDLAKKINKTLDLPIDIINITDPKKIKGIIGTAHIVVSSRFHGLVSSLSQGIPSIATGWSHKYSMLMSDYDAAELLVDFEKDDIISKIKYLMIEKEYINKKDKITKKSTEIKNESKKMWNDIIELIKNKQHMR